MNHSTCSFITTVLCPFLLLHLSIHTHFHHLHFQLCYFQPSTFVIVHFHWQQKTVLPHIQLADTQLIQFDSSVSAVNVIPPLSQISEFNSSDRNWHSKREFKAFKPYATIYQWIAGLTLQNFIIKCCIWSSGVIHRDPSACGKSHLSNFAISKPELWNQLCKFYM